MTLHKVQLRLFDPPKKRRPRRRPAAAETIHSFIPPSDEELAAFMEENPQCKAYIPPSCPPGPSSPAA